MKENTNEEYIAQLEKQLEQEKSEEEDIQIVYDEEIQKQLKEIKSLEEEINSLKPNNNEKLNFIDIANDNFINILKKEIIDDLTLKLNGYFAKYDKEIEGKINQMRVNINKESIKIVNDQFVKLLNEINQNNEKLSNDYLNKQEQIMININKIKKELEINNQTPKEGKKEPNDSDKKFSNKSSQETKNLIYDNNNKLNKRKTSNKNIKKDSNNNFSNKNSGEIKDSKKNLNKFSNKGQYKDIKEFNNEFNNSNSWINNSENGPIDGRNSHKKNKGKDNNELNYPEFNNRIKNIDNNISQNSNEKENINDEDNVDNSFSYNINDSNIMNKNSKTYFNRKNQVNMAPINNTNKEEKNVFNFNKPKQNPIIAKANNIKNIINNANNKNNDTIKMIPLAKEHPIEKKPTKKAAFNSVKKIFYTDKNLKFWNPEKISEEEKEIIERELDKEMKENNTILKDYCLNFIEETVAPLFKRRDISDDKREIIKYNIETILELCGMDKNHYRYLYNPEAQNKKKYYDRNKSIEALGKFRKEFGISEKEFTDEGILARLIENNLDINKTFQKMFG